jgi:DNA-binding MarR family transcriptional regulator
MDDPAPLPPRLETTRQALLLANQIGVRATNAIVEAGLGELSSNVAIAALTHLAGEGPSRPRDLLQTTRLTRGGLSNLFDRLEATGFITRSYGTVPGDRRSATITITAAGADALASIDDIVATTLDSLRSDLAELATVLDSIAAERGRSATDVLTRASMSRAGLLSLAGAAMSKALADVDPDDPTPSKTAVVLACAAQPNHTRPGQLIGPTGLSSSGVSQLLDRLENAGLIRRDGGRPPDRRVVTVELTTQGRHQLERRLTRIAEHLSLLGEAVREPRRRAQ